MSSALMTRFFSKAVSSLKQAQLFFRAYGIDCEFIGAEPPLHCDLLPSIFIEFGRVTAQCMCSAQRVTRDTC